MPDGLSIFLIAFMFLNLLVFCYISEKKIGKADLLSPLFFIVSMMIVAYGIRPLAMIDHMDEGGTFSNYYHTNRSDIFLYSLSISFLGIISIILGYSSQFYKLIISYLPDLEISSPKRARNLSLFFILVGISAFIYILPEILNQATLSFFSQDSRTEFIKIWKGRGHIMFFVMNLTAFFSVYCYCTYKLCDKKQKLIGNIFTVFIFLCCLSIYAFTGSRAPLLGLILSLIFIRHYYIKRISTFTQTAIVILLPLIGGTLGLILTNYFETNQEISITNFISDIFIRVSGTFDQFEMLSASIEKANNFYFGLTYIEDIFLTYLPRAIFIFKPEIYGTLRLQNEVMPHLYEYAGLSASYPVGFFGEAYLNFHIMGIILVPYLFGVLVRTLYEKSKEANTLYGIVLIMMLASNVAIVRSLGGTIVALLVYIFMFKILFCMKLGSKSTPEAA